MDRGFNLRVAGPILLQIGSELILTRGVPVNILMTWRAVVARHLNRLTEKREGVRSRDRKRSN